MDYTVFGWDLTNFIFVICSIDTKTVLEFVHLIRPIESEFDSGIFYIATIDKGGQRSCSRQHWRRHQPVFGLFDIKVGHQVQTVLCKLGIKSDICLFGGFPG
ncbi:hypothetical protein D3C72_2139700 [compost metagenome]